MIHLLWLSLAVPLVIHLVHRKKAREVPFSTLRFLRMVDRRVARRHRLKELLLLATRILLLALLIAALYRPLLRSALWQGKDVPTAAVIVLDNSLSMQATTQGRRRHDKALAAVRTILEGLKKGDGAAIVRFPDAAEDAPAISTDQERLLGQAESLPAGWGTGSAVPALRRAADLLRTTEMPRRELYLVSDFQTLAWQPVLREFGGTFDDLPVFVIEVGSAVEENLALKKADFGLQVQAAGTASDLFCTVANTGSANASSPLELVVEGRPAGEQEIGLAAGALRMAAFRHAFTRAGPVWGTVRLAADDLPADNARYFTTNVRQSVPVLLVNGDPSTVPYEDETYFLEMALQVADVGGQSLSPIRTHTVTSADMAGESLGDYACVVLANVPRMDPTGADRLRRYVRDGGGLILFAGDRVAPGWWNEALGADVLPALFLQASEAAPGMALEWIDRSHPMFAGLSGSELPRVQAEHYLQLQPHADASVLAQLGDSPLLAERKLGSGTVLMFATAADMDWSNLPARPFFLPLMHQAVYYAGLSVNSGSGLQVQAPLSVQLLASRQERTIQLYGPPDGEEPLRTRLVEPGPGGPVTVLEHASRPGIYRAVWQAHEVEQTRMFAVNVAPEESRLASLPAQEVARALAGRSATVIGDTQALASAVNRQRQGLPLWNYLFAAVIGLAVLESWIGNIWLRRSREGR